MQLKEVKKFLDKFWFLLWKDDSLKGWFFSLIFLFIFIKFLFLPGLSLITGTALPLAIVESCSMYHPGNFLSDYDEWWENWETKYTGFEIDKETFDDFRFGKGLNKGDILFVIKANPKKLKVGDVIIFDSGQQNPIIHRIVSTNKENEKFIFSTIGDNNNGQLASEKEIGEDKLIGKAALKIAPYLGWGKLIFYEYRQKESNKGFCKTTY